MLPLTLNMHYICQILIVMWPTSVSFMSHLGVLHVDCPLKGILQKYLCTQCHDYSREQGRNRINFKWQSQMHAECFSGYPMDDCDGSPWIYLELFLRHFSLIGVRFIFLASLRKANQMSARSYSLPDEFRFLSDTQERLERSWSFQGTIIITLSLPQDEQCHYMLAERTCLNLSFTLSCKLFLCFVNQPAMHTLFYCWWYRCF